MQLYFILVSQMLSYLGGDIMRIDGYELIGYRISKYRKLRGLTQAELAEKIELSPTEISNIERGKNGISFNTLVNLCKELDVCSSELLSGAIKDTIAENIIDLIRQMNASEQEMLFKLLLTYTESQNLK